MYRHLLPSSFALLFLCGCPLISEADRDALVDPDGDGEPWNDYHHEYGVAFAEAGDCVEVDLSSLDEHSNILTFDLYLKGEIAGEQAWDVFPLVVWPGRFAFYEQAGRLSAGLPELVELDEDNSADEGFMDGGYHHVSFTHNDSATFDVYIDGAMTRVSDSNVALGESEEDVLYIGCWPEHDVSMVGVIGELRFLDVAYYNGNLDEGDDGDITWRPYNDDGTVVGLWHFDEGEGTSSAGAGGSLPATLNGVSWEHFDLACLDASLDCGPHPIVYDDADNDGAGTDEDCDDDAGDVKPGTTEKCNGYDDDCDGYIDEDDPEIDSCEEETR